MKRFILSMVVCACGVAIPILGGCDDQASSSKTQTHTNPNGSTTVDKNSTTVDSNGNKTSTQEHHTAP